MVLSNVWGVMENNMIMWITAAVLVCVILVLFWLGRRPRPTRKDDWYEDGQSWRR